MTEHAVIATYQLGGDGFGSDRDLDQMQNMEERLRAAVEQAGIGEFDGSEIGDGAVTIYLYGPDADALFAVAENIFRSFPLRPATVVLRYGDVFDVGAREARVEL